MKQLTASAACIGLLCLIAGCKKTTSESNQIKASIHSTCISVINLEHTHSYAEKSTTSPVYYVGGYSPGDADELGVVFYGQPTKTTYDLAGSTPFPVVLFWDPGNDEVNQYGAVSGEVEVVSLEWSGDEIVFIELRIRNVSVANESPTTWCVNEGLIFWSSL